MVDGDGRGVPVSDLPPARILDVTSSVVVHVDQERDDSRLGASESAGVLGLDKYKPPIAIWRKHRGMAVADDAKEAALWGQVLEPVVRARYALDRQRTVFVPTSSFLFEDWLRATPDGILLDVPDPTPHVEEVAVSFLDLARRDPNLGLLQVKTCSAWLADDWVDGPPPKYEAQVRVEMAVTGLPWCDIICLAGGQRLLGPFRIERDLQIEDGILKRLRAFWGMVESGDEPTVDDSDAWRIHISERMGRREAIEVPADDHALEIIGRWRGARAQRKRAERDEEGVRNEMLLKLSALGATKLDAGILGKPSAYRTKSGTWALKTPSHWRDE